MCSQNVTIVDDINSLKVSKFSDEIMKHSSSFREAFFSAKRHNFVIANVIIIIIPALAAAASTASLVILFWKHGTGF